jgi:hypothetical protein
LVEFVQKSKSQGEIDDLENSEEELDDEVLDSEDNSVNEENEKKEVQNNEELDYSSYVPSKADLAEYKNKLEGCCPDFEDYPKGTSIEEYENLPGILEFKRWRLTVDPRLLGCPEAYEIHCHMMADLKKSR